MASHLFSCADDGARTRCALNQAGLTASFLPSAHPSEDVSMAIGALSRSIFGVISGDTCHSGHVRAVTDETDIRTQRFVYEGYDLTEARAL